MILTLAREGEFPVGWVHSHEHQCGNKGTPILHYRVEVKGHDTDVNKQGWLLDNNAIPSYFESKYAAVSDFLSCEHIAKVACHDVAALVRESGGQCFSVKVSVTGIPGSWITCEWDSEEERRRIVTNTPLVKPPPTPVPSEGRWRSPP